MVLLLSFEPESVKKQSKPPVFLPNYAYIFLISPPIII